MLTLQEQDKTSSTDHRPIPDQDFNVMSLKDEIVEASSAIVLGPPLQASSPSVGRMSAGLPIMEGGGDCHSLRSVHNLLSPIRISKTLHSVHCVKTATPSPQQHPPPHHQSQQQPKPHPNSLEALNRFLAGIESDSPSKKYHDNENHSAMPEELLLSEKLSGMDEPDVKALLAKVLIENMGLRQELGTKEKRLTAYKGQMLAILDWKVGQQTADEGIDGTSANISFDHDFRRFTKKRSRRTRSSSGSRSSVDEETGIGETEGVNETTSQTKCKQPNNNCTSSNQEIRVVEEVYGVRRSLSFIQGLASSIDVDQELLKHRIKDGCYLTNQLLAGGVAGWMIALFVKKFGKIALTALGGGVFLLVYTARKGYVNVNYESIYQELSKICDTNMEDDADDDISSTREADDFMKSFYLNKSRSEEACENDTSFIDDSKAKAEQSRWPCLSKLRHVRKWIRSHTYTVSGFVLGFAYNIV